MNKHESIEFFGMSDMGRQRTNNEDAFVAERLDEDTLLAVVIDGVGGYEGGEVAAEIAQTEISRYMHDFTNGERLELLKQAVISANNAIYERRQVDTARTSMSCVLTAALIDVKRKVVEMVHVGDTRLYQFHHDHLIKLSHDHSLVGYREEIGDLTEEQAMHHPQRNVISRDVGSERHEVEDPEFLETAQFPLLPNSTFLFCSDGLTDLITSHQIVAILKQNLSLEERTRALIDEANKAGGKDNITVILVNYQAEEKKEVPIKQPLNTTVETGGSISTEDALYATSTKKTRRLLAYFISLIVISLLGAIAYICFFIWNPQKDIHYETNQEKQSSQLNKNLIDSVLTYDKFSDHPWSSFLSVDSNYVLRLEHLFSDSLGSVYRVFVYDHLSSETGEGSCNPLERPTYIGYGFPVHEMDQTMMLRFDNTAVASDRFNLILSYNLDNDSVVVIEHIPFSNNPKDSNVVFVIHPWDNLEQNWKNPMCKN